MLVLAVGFCSCTTICCRLLSVYDCSPWSVVFFFIFLIVQLYGVVNLTMAVVYTQYQARRCPFACMAPVQLRVVSPSTTATPA